ncbi:MAG: glycosyltransferase family 2 protein [Nitrosomonadales bacterium]|nr:glycosyltransferase family 2 protein [Nitrosomonadales bacterium]
MSNCTLSIVIPVYRSAPILPRLVEAIADEMQKEDLSGRFELILVNDCSPDDSWQVIRKLAENHDFIRGITLRRNVGQHNAIMAGLHHVNGEYVVLMDDDLQHPPSAIADILKALADGHDVCYTNYLNRQHAAWKKLGSWFNDRMATLLLGKPKGLYLSSFKGMHREIAEEIVHYDGPYTYLDGLILDVTRSITTVDIEHQARFEGESNYTFTRLFSLWMKMATSFSVFPLRLATYAGFGLAALSLVMIVVVIVQKIMFPELPRGWASTIATILFIGGIQTLCIGLVGEYLGRTYLKLNRKRQFVIGSTTWQKRGEISAK